ncbi:MAG: hypothetical protein ACI4R6_07125, partial [Lachnospiraceae bacterium]
KTFNEWQQDLDTELVKSAESFVRIGYLLKVARDTDILRESGYAGVVEFARNRYGLDKTQVSRFIHINDRFSVNGNSEELQDKYKGFGYAKLTIMLQLPDAINEELSPDFSKTEIEDIKKEFDEEKKISDLEILIEGQKEETKELNGLEQVLYQLLHDTPELFTSIHTSGYEAEKLKETLAPSGEMIYSVRIQGVGRLIMTINAGSGKITITNARNMEKTEWNMGDLVESVINVFSTGVDTQDSRELWTSIYKEPYPEKEEKVKVAPVQQEEKKPVQKKEKKVRIAKVAKEEKEAPVAKEEKPEVTEEQIPGQDTIMNHKEYIPEDMKPEENTPVPAQYMAADVINVPETVIDTPETVIDIPETVIDAPESVIDIPESTSEMPTNAINTKCEPTSDVDELEDYELSDRINECWEIIVDAHRKIGLFIEDYGDGANSLERRNIESAKSNATAIINELGELLKLEKL